MNSPTQKRALVFAAREATEVAGVTGPLSLGLTNHVVLELRETGQLERVAAAFRKGLGVAYVPAHDCDPGLLDPEELVDEIRLNEIAVHQILGAPAPERRVAVLPCTVDGAAVAALEDHGIDALVLPRAPDEPCRLGERLVLLSGVELVERPPQGEWLTLDELQRNLTPPWLPRVDPAAPLVEERPGAAVSAVLGWLGDALGFQRAPRLAPTALFDQDYRLEKLPPRVSVPLLFRLTRHRSGISREAARQLLDLLCTEVELGLRPEPRAALPEWAKRALPDVSLYEALERNGWRGRDRWLELYRGVRYGELMDNCMMRSIAIL